MATVSCPTCGYPNASNRVTCQQCQGFLVGALPVDAAAAGPGLVAPAAPTRKRGGTTGRDIIMLTGGCLVGIVIGVALGSGNRQAASSPRAAAVTPAVVGSGEPPPVVPPPAQPTTAQAAAPAAPAKPELEILSHRTQPSGIADRVTVIGEVRNNATTARRFVQVTATFYDGSQAVIGTGFAFASNGDAVPPGETRPFTLGAAVSGTPASYKLDISGRP